MTLSEHRAAARMAWRYARKAKARTALILFLIALPIAALAGAGILITTAIANPEDRLTAQIGSADVTLGFQASSQSLKKLTDELPVGTVMDTMKQVTAYKIGSGTLHTLTVQEHSVPADRAPAAAEYALFGGSMPHAAGEATMTPRTAKSLGVHIGDTVHLDDFATNVRITGLAVLRFDLRTDLVVVGPGTVTDQTPEPNLLIQLPKGFSAAAAEDLAQRAGLGVLTRAQLLSAHDEKLLTGASFAAAVVALLGTGLIVATAFGVGARRQLRAHGLMEAAGGERKHVLAVVLWGGAILGLVGSVVGIGLAVAAAYTVSPHIEGLVNRIIDAVRIPWWVLVGGVALGTIAATIAAIGPARQAAQISAVDALAGRSPRPQPAGRLARRGSLAVLIGLVLTIAATNTQEHVLLAISLGVTLIGFLFVIPLLVNLVGRSASHLSAIPRLAARQTARYGRRTGAAVAAATIALTAPIAVSTWMLSNDTKNNRQITIANDQMVLSAYSPLSGNSIPNAVLAAAGNALRNSVVAPVVLAATGVPSVNNPVVQMVPQGQPFATTSPGGSFGTAPQAPPAPSPGEQPVQVSGPPLRIDAHGDPIGMYEGGVLGVADRALLIASHADAAIPYLDGDKIIAVGFHTDDGVVHFQSANGPQTIDVPAIAVPGGAGPGYNLPRYFIPEHMLKEYNMHAAAPTQALLRSPHHLTSREIDAVKHAVSLIPGAFAQAQRDYLADSVGARLAMSGGAVGVALIIVAVAVSLVGAESRRERAILSAVGAGPGARRQLVGANALLLTSLASIIALPAGLIPMWLILRSERPSTPVVLPWSVLAIVVIGTPVVAGILAALASRAPKARAMLQPNW